MDLKWCNNSCFFSWKPATINKINLKKLEQSKYFCLFSLVPQRNCRKISPPTHNCSIKLEQLHFFPATVHITQYCLRRSWSLKFKNDLVFLSSLLTTTYTEYGDVISVQYGTFCIPWEQLVLQYAERYRKSKLRERKENRDTATQHQEICTMVPSRQRYLLLEQAHDVIYCPWPLSAELADSL